MNRTLYFSFLLATLIFCPSLFSEAIVTPTPGGRLIETEHIRVEVGLNEVRSIEWDLANEETEDFGNVLWGHADLKLAYEGELMEDNWPNPGQEISGNHTANQGYRLHVRTAAVLPEDDIPITVDMITTVFGGNSGITRNGLYIDYVITNDSERDTINEIWLGKHVDYALGPSQINDDYAFLVNDRILKAADGDGKDPGTNYFVGSKIITGSTQSLRLTYRRQATTYIPYEAFTGGDYDVRSDTEQNGYRWDYEGVFTHAKKYINIKPGHSLTFSIAFAFSTKSKGIQSTIQSLLYARQGSGNNNGADTSLTGAGSVDTGPPIAPLEPASSGGCFLKGDAEAELSKGDTTLTGSGTIEPGAPIAPPEPASSGGCFLR